MNKKKFSATQELYAGLVEEVMSLIRAAIADGEESLDTALTELFTYIERSVVCTLRAAFSPKISTDIHIRSSEKR
jgi:hypothetical protein